MFSSRARLTAMLAAGFAAAAVLSVWQLFPAARAGETAFGVTFSTLQAKELGLDWKTAYLATLDDLGVRRLRLPVYWNAVEQHEGAYDWSEVDWMLEQAGQRGARVTLAIGRKTPRWPECHVPEWAAALPPEEQNRRVLEFLAAEVEHFKNRSAIERWQVENEPFFRFGQCPPPDEAQLQREIDLVRSLDGRPVLVTESGELSTWRQAGRAGDLLGISLYRLVWNDRFGSLYWPVSPSFYSDHIRLLTSALGPVIVSELQGEPWFHEPVTEMPLEAQRAQMNAARLRANIAFAAASGASEVYLWGVEWWYWLSAQGDQSAWEAARAAFRS